MTDSPPGIILESEALSKLHQFLPLEPSLQVQDHVCSGPTLETSVSTIHEPLLLELESPIY